MKNLWTNGPIFDAANGTNVPYDLPHDGIPRIKISTGSIAANGAISGITALPFAYPRALCYFPANAVATVAAAGWRYCTFSTTTAGTAFLDTYSGTGPFVVPTSPAAVTDGRGAYTGVTTEIVAASVPVAAGAMGINGNIEAIGGFTVTNNANVKAGAIYLGGMGGSVMISQTLASNLRGQAQADIYNSGNAAVQIARITGMAGSTINASTNSGTINTANATTVDFTLSGTTATDNEVLETYRVRVSFSN